MHQFVPRPKAAAPSVTCRNTQLVLWASVAGWMLSLPAHAATITVFDPPGSVETHPISINRAGSISGNYKDSNGVYHGFARAADGTITAFDPPGSGGTWAPSINDAGEIAGYYGTSDGNVHGYKRAADGTVTSFDPPQSFYTIAVSINRAGAITGEYSIPGVLG